MENDTLRDKINIERGDEFEDQLTSHNSDFDFSYFLKQNLCINRLYFIFLYIFTISCFVDIYLYLAYFKIDESNKILSKIFFIIRLISDVLLIIPIFIFRKNISGHKLKCALFLKSVLYFLPQTAFNIVSIVFIFIFVKDDVIYKNKDKRIILEISTFINSGLHAICMVISAWRDCCFR